MQFIVWNGNLPLSPLAVAAAVAVARGKLIRFATFKRIATNFKQQQKQQQQQQPQEREKIGFAMATQKTFKGPTTSDSIRFCWPVSRGSLSRQSETAKKKNESVSKGFNLNMICLCVKITKQKLMKKT